MEIRRPVTQHTTPYKAFISQESYEKYSLTPSFTEYLEQATSLRLQEQRNSAQLTAQQASAKGPKLKGVFSRGQNVDSCPAPAPYGAADSDIQFPCVSRISSQDQESFLEEYRGMLRGDMDKLELDKMKTVQELKSVILAEQEEFQQFAYQQALAHHEMYNIVPPAVKMACEEEMCKSNKSCVQDYPQYYSLCQTLGLSVGAVYKSDPIMQHEQTVLQLGNVPVLCLPDNVVGGVKLLGHDGVSGPKVSPEANVTKRKPLSQDATALNLAKRFKVDLVVTSEALKTLIDNEGPDYKEQWELPVCVQPLTGIGGSAAGKPRKIIFIDDPLPKKLLTPYSVNCDYYRRALRKLLSQGQGGHDSLPRQGNEETIVPVHNGGENNHHVVRTQGSFSTSSLEGDSLTSDKKEESCGGEENLTRFCSVTPVQENVSSFCHLISSKHLKQSASVADIASSKDNFHPEGNTEDTVTQSDVGYSDPTLHQDDATETTSTLTYQEDISEKTPSTAHPENTGNTAGAVPSLDLQERIAATVHLQTSGEESILSSQDTEQAGLTLKFQKTDDSTLGVTSPDQAGRSLHWPTKTDTKCTEMRTSQAAYPQNNERSTSSERSLETERKGTSVQSPTETEAKCTEKQTSLAVHPHNDEKATSPEHSLETEQTDRIDRTQNEAETMDGVCFQERKELTAASAHTQGETESLSVHSKGAEHRATVNRPLQDGEETSKRTMAQEDSEVILQSREDSLAIEHSQTGAVSSLVAQNTGVCNQDTGERPTWPTHVKDCIKHEDEGARLQDTDGTTPSSQLNKKEQHMDVTEDPRDEQNPAGVQSQGRKRRAASAEHSKDEENNSPSVKVPRFEAQMENSGQMSELTDSLVHTLWRFGRLKILVQSSLDAYRENPTKPKSYAFFSVMTKLQYQPSLGFTRLTSSETSRYWLHSFLRPNTKLLCGHINVHSSEVMKIDELEISDILNSGVVFNPTRGMKMVWQVLNGLSPLSDGQYLLCHAPRDIHCCLYASVDCGTASGRRSVYDLHQAHSTVGDVVAFTGTEIPWVAMDTNRFLPKHIKDNRIPCTFPAVPARILVEMQAEEKPKETKVQNSKKKRKRNKKTRVPQKAGVDKPQNTNPASNPSTEHSPRRVNTRQQKKGRPGVQLLAHSSLDDVNPCYTDVSLSRRTVAPISYDDIDFGES